MAQKVTTVWRKLGDALFQDETGKYVAGQPPNIAVYLILAGFLGKSISSGLVYEFFDLLATGAVFAWAFLEIVYGKSVFRRILGSIVMIVFFVGRLS